MRVIGFAGWSGAGKTTLLAKLIPELTGRGLSVSTLKHAHHAFDVDQPGKDSHTHRQAGATEVLISSSRRYALIHELRDEAEPQLPDLLQRLSAADLVLVEGFKRAGHPKIEVHRAANGRRFLFPDIPSIVALATDADLPDELHLPALGLNDVPGIAEAVLAFALPLGETLARLSSEPVSA